MTLHTDVLYCIAETAVCRFMLSDSYTSGVSQSVANEVSAEYLMKVPGRMQPFTSDWRPRLNMQWIYIGAFGFRILDIHRSIQL